MDALVIGLVGLGGLYTIANQNKKKEKRENFNLQAGENEKPTSFPLQNNDVSENVNKFVDQDKATNKYYNQTLYQKEVKKDTNSGSMLPDNNTFSSLSGKSLDTNAFQHNNMVPFFGAKITGRHSLYDGDAEAILDNTNGTGSQVFRKVEQAPLFKPQENVQWTHGTPNFSNFYESRVNPGKAMNNTKPWYEVRVGPGLGKGFESCGSGGFNSGLEDRKAWQPYTVDRLRTKTNPKITYGLKGHEGPARLRQGDVGKIGQVNKNLPDTYYDWGPDRYFTTGGVQKDQTARPIQEVHETHRMGTTASYEGAAGAEMKKQMAHENYSCPIKPHTYGQIMGPAGTNVAPATEGDYAQKGYSSKPNNRISTNANSYGTPGGGIISAIVSPLMDVLRPSRKENFVGNIRSSGNGTKIGAGGHHIYNPGDQPKTTIKEMTVKGAQHLNVHNNKTYGSGYTTNPQISTDTQRQTTSYQAYGGPSSAYGDMSVEATANQRNNDKVLSSYAPTGNTNMFQNEINMSTNNNKIVDHQRDMAPSSMPNAIPNSMTYGQLHGGQQYQEPERMTEDILDAFKQNPYTHSLNTSV